MKHPPLFACVKNGIRKARKKILLIKIKEFLYIVCNI